MASVNPSASPRHIEAKPGVRRLTRFVRRAWYAGAARMRGVASRIHRDDALLVFLGRVAELARAPAIPAGDVVFRRVPVDEVLMAPDRYASSRTNATNGIAGQGSCYIGELNGRIVFRMWTVTLDGPALDRLAPGVRGRSLFIHDCWTEPEARGQRIYPAALSWLARESVECYDHLVLTITSRNTPALRAVAKVGFLTANSVAGRRAPALHDECARAGEGQAATGATPVSPAGLLEIVRDVLQLRGGVWVAGTGSSMYPTLTHGAGVAIERWRGRLEPGLIVLLEGRGGPVIHRVVAIRPDAVYTRGDAALEGDGWTPIERVLGVAVATAPLPPSGRAASGFRLVGDLTLETAVAGTAALLPTLRFGWPAFLRHLRGRAYLAAARARLRLTAQRGRAARGRSPLPGDASTGVGEVR